MTIDTAIEDIFPLFSTEFDQHYPGPRVHRNTRCRWALRGLLPDGASSRVKLDTIMLSGVRYCSAEAIARFIAAQNPSTPAPTVITKVKRRRQSEDAGRVLAEMGAGSAR